MSPFWQNVCVTMIGAVITALLSSGAVASLVQAGSLPAWAPTLLQAILLGLGAYGYQTRPVQRFLGR